MIIPSSVVNLNLDPQVTSWGWNRLAALDAYTQVGIPKSCGGSARRYTCGYKIKDKWQALHHITHASLVPVDVETDYFECGPAFRKKAAAFKLKLTSLPELGFWNDHSSGMTTPDSTQ